MMSDMERFETVANNLANVQTHGYKRHMTLHHDFQQGFVERIQTAKLKLSVDGKGELVRDIVSDSPRAIGELGTGTMVTGSWTHFDDGSMQATESPFDLALKGGGFFTVQGPNGELRFTRNGHFKLNSDNDLVSADGWQLLGRQGPISLEPGAKPSIGADGSITVNGKLVDRLVLVDFDGPQRLINEGNNRYAALEGMNPKAAEATVSQGYLEQANVDVAAEMVQMITALRSYQISQKALQSEDEMSGRLINDVGRV